ncbi:PEGA domain-containing protein [Sorangium sp. So ce216]
MVQLPAPTCPQVEQRPVDDVAPPESPVQQAERLATYVREMAADVKSTAAERQQGAAMYAEARAKVGTVVVRTDVEGALVFVDGTLRGMTPLADPLFVEPGVHTISVEREGYETQQVTMQLGAGALMENGLKLQRKPTGAPPPPEPPRRVPGA